MQCQICKAELPAGARVCPSCGAPTPYNVLEPEKEQAPSSSLGSPEDTLIKRRSEISAEDSERTLRAPYNEPTVRAPSRWQQPPVSGEERTASQPPEEPARGSESSERSDSSRAKAEAGEEPTPTVPPGASATTGAPTPASSPPSTGSPPVPPPRDAATSYGWIPPSPGSGTPSYPGLSGAYPPAPTPVPAGGSSPQQPGAAPAGPVSQSGGSLPGFPPSLPQQPGPATPSYPGYPPPIFGPGPTPAGGASRELGASWPQQGQPGWPSYLPQATPGAPGTPVPGPVFAPTPSAPGQARGGRPILLLVLTILLICVLILLGSTIYLGVIRPGQEHAAATATAQSATALARSHQTATAVARANATATVTALQNDPQAFYNYLTAQTPQVNDSLASQSASQWDETRHSDGSGCQFSNGALHVLTSSSTRAWGCAAAALTYHNLAFQVDMTILKGDTSGAQTMGGLVFRLDATAGSFYSFTISPAGAYLLSKVDGGNFTSLADGLSNAIRASLGQSNTLTIIAQESTLMLFVNGHYLATVHDSTLTSGEIGLIALGTGKTAVDAAFQNLKIWQL